MCVCGSNLFKRNKFIQVNLNTHTQRERKNKITAKNCERIGNCSRKSEQKQLKITDIFFFVVFFHRNNRFEWAVLSFFSTLCSLCLNLYSWTGNGLKNGFFSILKKNSNPKTKLKVFFVLFRLVLIQFIFKSFSI